ncbi:Transmembrane protein [Plasmodiophora brassicae]
MRPGHEYINTRGTPNSASCQEGNLASVSGPLPVQNDGTLPAYTPPSHFNSQKPEPTYRSSASGKQVPPSKTSPPLKVETPASMSPSKRNASTLWRVGVASTVLGVGVAARRWYGSRQSSRNPHGRPGGVPGTLLHRREVIGGAGAALSGAIYLALRYQRVRGRTSTDLDRLVTPTPVESKKTSYPSLLMAIVASVFATVIAVGIVIACAVSRRRRLQAANRLHDASDDYALFAKKLTVNSGTQF